VGDGRSTLAELARRERPSANVSQDTDFFRYRRLAWSHVPAQGERVTLDYKYASPFEHWQTTSTNRLDELAASPLVEQLNAWGPLFWQFVPQDIRQGTLYTVDFVVCPTRGVQLLEMNCNPMVPPEAYGVILKDAVDGRIAGTQTVHAPMPPPVVSKAPLQVPASWLVPSSHRLDCLERVLGIQLLHS
jgi:hypothetical protein